MLQNGKVGVLIESHFDETEFHRFNEAFPAEGYEVEYLSHLWGQEQLTFQGNDMTSEVVVSTEINDVQPTDYAGIILIGGYAMDRLRYEAAPQEGEPNRSPAVEFLRKAVAAMDAEKLLIGAICHGLWLFCADPDLMQGRKVTCAHNILCDVINAGGVPAFDGEKMQESCVDGNLITGQHPGAIEPFLVDFFAKLKK